MMKIGFVRHGSTAWNKERRAQGNSDIPLDNDGRDQAAKLANRLVEEDWDIIYSSDLMRASQTAEAIGGRMDNKKIIADRRLREVSGGKIEGTTEEERIKKWGVNWRELDMEIESSDKVIERGMYFLEEAVQKHADKNILIVSHGSYIKHLLIELLPKLEHESLHNCSLTTLQKSSDEWEVVLHNCTKHLA
ncbi:histidine phosphatase family protein [Virgibacillus flavescens]|uniref:histidine phosphatase family protein n=1 Tax=Virgibacillus flavescens TaxID=1611422 RepID=UPI003D329515